MSAARYFNILLAVGRLIGLIWLLTGCGPQTTGEFEPKTLTVFAAASLTDVFTDIALQFEADYPEADVVLNFAGSQALRLQIEQGAPVDLLASANQAHMQALIETALMQEAVIFTYNQLVVIVPAHNPAVIETLAGLTEPGLKLVLAGPNVPVGRYARLALHRLNHHPELPADYAEQVLRNLVSEEDNVKSVVAKVRLGEADAGIVYVSDVTPTVAGEVMTLPLPPDFNVIAAYPLAIATDSPEPGLARQFMTFVLSAPGQTILSRHGFQPLPALAAEDAVESAVQDGQP